MKVDRLVKPVNLGWPVKPALWALRIFLAIFTALLIFAQGDGLAVQLAPLEYLNRTGATVARLTFIMFCCLGYFLAIRKLSSSELKKRPIVQVFARFGAYCALVLLGYCLPILYMKEQTQFVQFPGNGLKMMERATELEKSVGFKVAVEQTSDGNFLYFRRAPGAAEKVEEWLRQNSVKQPQK